jgi:hypothetical protein
VKSIGQHRTWRQKTLISLRQLRPEPATRRVTVKRA